jgi:hypothetical protein
VSYEIYLTRQSSDKRVQRRTAYFVLGLIASTVGGVEALDDLGWESVLNPLGQPTGLCVPVDLDQFVDVSSSLSSLGDD